jgi:hypothetical protein
MTFWEHSITAIWWKAKGGWLETEITQNELENTARYMFNLALEQNLQRPQLEYAMMIHSTVFTPLHSSSTSWNVKDLMDRVTYRVIILRIYQTILSIIILQETESSSIARGGIRGGVRGVRGVRPP